MLGSLTPGQALVGIVHEELTALMGGANAELNLAATPPAVLLMAGLQGSGKTTTCGKLALLQERARRSCSSSADVYRPAAIDQLRRSASSSMSTASPEPRQRPDAKIAAPPRRPGAASTFTTC